MTANEIVDDLERDYIRHTNDDPDERLPIRSKKEIKGLIWNLLRSEKYKLPGKVYNEVMRILFDRME